MGVEFSTDADSGCYTFEPLTDDIIKSLSISPVTNKSMLHATSILEVPVMCLIRLIIDLNGDG